MIIEDYNNFLKSVGMTDEEVITMMNKEDVIVMPKSAVLYMIKSSNIQGRGYFLSVNVETDDIIAPALLSGKRTPAGRYINHSPTPNAEPVIIDSNIYIQAITTIAKDEEVTVNYRQSQLIATKLANSF